MSRSVVLAVLALSYAACAAAQSSRSEATFYFLVRQWPETFCQTTGCSVTPPSTTAWTLHGLWPNFNCAGYPEQCSNERFSSSAVGDLYNDLATYWPSYKSSNQCFWAHEYECHGTCNIENLDQHDYFAKTLELHQRYNVEDALAARGIVPDDTKEYATREMEDALEAAWGARPVIRCRNGLVDEIHMCIDADYSPGKCAYDCQGRGCERTNCDAARYPVQASQGSGDVPSGCHSPPCRPKRCPRQQGGAGSSEF